MNHQTEKPNSQTKALKAHYKYCIINRIEWFKTKRKVNNLNIEIA